jgi:hypothetical protein
MKGLPVNAIHKALMLDAVATVAPVDLGQRKLHSAELRSQRDVNIHGRRDSANCIDHSSQDVVVRRDQIVHPKPVVHGFTAIIAGQVTRTSDFSDSTGQALRLYETDAEPPPGTPSYVSSLTGSGIAAPAASSKRVLVPWIIGIAASLLFIYAASANV